LLSCSPSSAQVAVAKINPPSVAPPIGAYSHMAVVPPGYRMLYVAGQLGNRPDGTLAGTIEDQAIQALENIRLVLAAENAKPADIVKLTVYAAARPTNMAAITAKRAELFKGATPPPVTWVYISGLARPEYLIEVEAIAAVRAQ
jgi:2-iminobutanoate/2-iminopropanoate deaminase